MGLGQGCNKETNQYLAMRSWKKSKSPADTLLFPATGTFLYNSGTKMMKICARKHRSGPWDINLRRPLCIRELWKGWIYPVTFVPYSFPRGNEPFRPKGFVSYSFPRGIEWRGWKNGSRCSQGDQSRVKGNPVSNGRELPDADGLNLVDDPQPGGCQTVCGQTDIRSLNIHFTP